MSEKTISRADAADLKAGINRAIDALEDAGFDRSMIASAMIGVGAGIRAVNDGLTETLACLDGVRDVIMRETGRRQ